MMRRDVTTGWPIRGWLTLLTAIEAALLLAAFIGGTVALVNLGTSRGRLLDQIGPQLIQANRLSVAVLDQETGIRGYLLARRPDMLTPYTNGLRAQTEAVTQLRRLGAAPGTRLGDDLDAMLRETGAWQQEAAASISPGAPAPTADQLEHDRTLFDRVRVAIRTMLDHLDDARQQSRADLTAAGNTVTAILVVIGALIVATFMLLYLGLRHTVTRPIRRLAAEVRAVSDNDIHRPVRGSGPAELIQLAADVEAMRQRIVDEVSQLESAQTMLDQRSFELERSNLDLEQFAYVASHDMHEPLRKVAGFCRLLQKHYHGRLDERADQYIEFAVDGAKRMQDLIDDLLAFSRVGRGPVEHTRVDTQRLLGNALANLDTAGARITRGDLPEVRGEAALLTAVFQNLVGNALKFHGENPPDVRIQAEREDGEWVFSVIDHGIGVDPDYAERIFSIFQRLHTRGSYPGTGIGLAMCRRIVEYHGGRIWLDTEAETTTFRFTLPALEDGPANSEQMAPEGGVRHD